MGRRVGRRVWGGRVRQGEWEGECEGGRVRQGEWEGECEGGNVREG